MAFTQSRCSTPSRSYSSSTSPAQSYTHSSPPSIFSAVNKPARLPLTKSRSYQTDIPFEDSLELLPATTYEPPSPRGRLVTQQYIRPSLRLDHHMMPSTDEIMAATRGHRSSSTSSNGSTDTNCSNRSEKRQGRFFSGLPVGLDILDLLSETVEMEQ